MKGIIERDILGKSRGFKFGTYQMGLLSELQGTALSDLENVDADKNNFKTLINYLYSAAVSYCKSNKIQIDFTNVDVADWIDEIGLDEAGKIVSDGTEINTGIISKKVSAPQEGATLLSKTA